MATSQGDQAERRINVIAVIVAGALIALLIVLATLRLLTTPGFIAALFAALLLVATLRLMLKRRLNRHG